MKDLSVINDKDGILMRPKNRRIYCQGDSRYLTCSFNIPQSNVHLCGIGKFLPRISLRHGYWSTTDKLQETERDCISKKKEEVWGQKIGVKTT